MTFKTDPGCFFFRSLHLTSVCALTFIFTENDDYQMESGGSRTYELWQEGKAIEAANAKERQDEDKEDAMTALENRTRDTQKMVDMLDALDELRAVSQRNERVDAAALLRTSEDARRIKEAALAADDEALLKSIDFGGARRPVHLEEEAEKAFVLDEIEASAKPLKGKVKAKEVNPIAHQSPPVSSELEMATRVVAADAIEPTPATASQSLLRVVEARRQIEQTNEMPFVPVLRVTKRKPGSEEPSTKKARPLPDVPDATGDERAIATHVETVKSPQKEGGGGLLGLDYSSGDSD